MRTHLISLALFLITLVLARSAIHAESLSISLVVGTTEVILSGYTSPLSQVVVKEDGSVIGTTTSDSLGNWSKTISVAIPSLHTYELYVTDASSRISKTISYNLNVAGNTTTTISNIVLPPTLSQSTTTITGSGYPTATITLTSSSGDSYTTIIPGTGNWQIDLSSVLGGPYTLTATQSVGSYISLESTTLSFTGSTPTPSSTPNSSSSSTSISSPQPSTSIPPTITPTTSPSPKTPFFVPLYDNNQDGKLALSELFEVLKNWLTRHLPCDLNKDSKCNLIDLSILLYYFER